MSAVCAHGRSGWCYDEASPQAREDADFLFRHAFEYAFPYGDAELAEDYAAWLLARSYYDGEVLLDVSHRTDFQRFLSER